RRAAIARADSVRRMTTWLADESGPGIRLGSVETAEAPELLAAVPIDDGTRVVMTLDSAAVTAWIADWSAAHAAFDVTLDPPTATPTAPALVRSPLTPRLLSWQLVARVRPSDPGAEDR